MSAGSARARDALRDGPSPSEVKLDWVVGIDGGATRTRYLLADAAGRIRARSEGRGCLLGAGADGEVVDEIVRRVTALAEQADVSLPIDVLCAGLAGAGGPVDALEKMERQIARVGVAQRVRIVPDAEVAFMDAFGRGAGILLIAGTGSIALARAGNGSLDRTGGWGALLGDEGSGYRLGLKGLRAALRGTEGRAPSTRLTKTLFDALGVRTAHEVLDWSRMAEKSDLAALAPRVVAEADGGDLVAAELVRRAVEELGGHAMALCRGMPISDWPEVALAGGLIEPGGALHDRVGEHLSQAGFRLYGEPVRPARGAVRMAMDL